MSALDKAQIRLERLGTELKQARNQLQMVKARETRAEHKRRSRGLIILGGFVLSARPDIFDEALVQEDQPDKRNALAQLIELRGGDRYV